MRLEVVMRLRASRKSFPRGVLISSHTLSLCVLSLIVVVVLVVGGGGDTQLPLSLSK
jgi:hypothetical protein